MSSDNDQIITGIIAREGGYSNNVLDAGGETFEGISRRSNPEAFKNGPPTDAQVRAIYLQKYILGPGFDKVVNPALREQLVDWFVTSGYVAVLNLQKILGVGADGVLGPKTLTLANAADPRLLNNSLVVERIKMIGRLVQRQPRDVTFLSGWLNRCCSFLIP